MNVVFNPRPDGLPYPVLEQICPWRFERWCAQDRCFDVFFGKVAKELRHDLLASSVAWIEREVYDFRFCDVAWGRGYTSGFEQQVSFLLIGGEDCTCFQNQGVDDR